MKENETAVQPALYAVSLATAEEGIKSYKALMRQNFTGIPVNAFTIRVDDFLEVIGYTREQIAQLPAPATPHSHARMYMGYDSVAGYKLYLVPVDGANLNPPVKPGLDVIPSGEYQGLPGEKPSIGEYVYDLIAPCPSSCDTTSPLYKAV